MSLPAGQSPEKQVLSKHNLQLCLLTQQRAYEDDNLYCDCKMSIGLSFSVFHIF